MLEDPVIVGVVALQSHQKVQVEVQPTFAEGFGPRSSGTHRGNRAEMCHTQQMYGHVNLYGGLHKNVRDVKWLNLM